MERKPKIGDIVIYNVGSDLLSFKTDEESYWCNCHTEKQLPAIIVDVKNYAVSLQVFHNCRIGTSYVSIVSHGDNPDNWCWPVIPQ